MSPLARLGGLTALLLTACGEQAQENAATSDTASGAVAPSRALTASVAFDSGGRDQLCVKEGRAGLIVYAADADTNCAVRGTVNTNDSARFVMQPEGDEACKIEGRWDGSALTFGQVASACAYYCGPKASFEGARFNVVPASRPAVDIAGDPLC